MMVEIRGLRKRFGRLEVLRGIDLTVGPGRVTAVVGPNAAGKTTLIKTVLGLIRLGRSDGQITVGPDDVARSHRYRDRIGYMPQAARFPEHLTGWEIIAFLRRLRGDPRDVDLTLVAALDLERHLDKRVRELSGGTRQKLNAVVALMFRPSILILDEPTAGLDPRASAILKDRVRDAVKQGATVLLTSHLVSELEDLATELVFLVEGRVQYHGPIAELVAARGESKLERVLAGMLDQAR
jgi:Cu-processing system ATP-binding protein